MCLLRSLTAVSECPAGYVFYRLLKHRRNFGKLVANSNSALTTSRFIRLCLLAGAYILLTVPVTIYTLILQIQVGGAYAPYNWDWIHRGVGVAAQNLPMLILICSLVCSASRLLFGFH